MSDPAAIIADLGRVHAANQKLVEAVRPEQWSDPTPCTEWDVRALFNHVVGGDHLFAMIVTGDLEPDLEAARAALTEAGDQLGDEPAGAFRRAGEAALDAFSQPGFMEKIWPTPFGDQPGKVLVRMRITEHLVHGWDLARATGQPVSSLPDDLAADSLARARRSLPGGQRDGGPFGSEQDVAPDAPAIDRLAAFLGRSL